MRVTFQHLRTIPYFSSRRGFCRDGARRWCYDHGVDFKDFVRNGIDADRLRAIGDPFALALIDWARDCEAHRQPEAEGVGHGR